MIRRPTTRFVVDDGGRAAAGYRGHAGDCVARSVAIAAELPYQSVYDALNSAAGQELSRGPRAQRSSARNGVARPTIRRFMKELGWEWFPTMTIGSGTTVHLRADELPAGRLVVSCSRHLTAVIDGVIHDTHDPSRGGTRCVYGYWSVKEGPRVRFVAGPSMVELCVTQPPGPGAARKPAAR